MDENKIKASISKRFKELRKKHKLSQSKFAEEIGASASSISSYEACVSLPPVSVLAKISEKYSVSIDWICGKDVKDGYLNTVADLMQIYEEAKEKLGAQCIKQYRSDFDPLDTPTVGIFANNVTTEARVCKIIEDIDTMYNLCKNRTISIDIYNQWKNGRIEMYKTQDIRTLYSEYAEEINLYGEE